jgi:predicted N-acetyltransferase YhbS
MRMDFMLRSERPADVAAVEALTREAFWNLHCPGCSEHLVARQLRASRDFVPELDLVAEAEGRVVGSILFSRSRVAGSMNEHFETVTFGPVSALPEYQRQGVGRALIERGVQLARAIGFSAVIIYGNPAYYGRFGFRPGKEFGIRTAEGKYLAALQALPLAPGALDGVSGRFLESEAFETDPAQLEAFDRLFPPKEKLVTPSQAEFLKIALAVEDA